MSNESTALPPPPKLPESLGRLLDRVCSRQLSLKLAEFPLRLAGFLALSWLIQAIVDRYLEMPFSLRVVLLVLNGLTSLALIYRFILQPISNRLNRNQAALLVEDRRPEFRSSLISAVELTSPNADYPAQSRPLVSQLLADVSSQVAKKNILPSLFPTHRLKRLLLISSLILAVAAGLFASQQPVASLLLERIFLSDAPLPSDTQDVSISEDLRLDPGADAILSARAEGYIPLKGKLVVVYPNGQKDVVEVLPAQNEAAVFTHVVRNARTSFLYHFELNDGVGEEHKVTVVIPPSLKEIHFVQLYPAYTGLPETKMQPAGLRLLQGSKLRVQAVASIALSSAMLEIAGLDAPSPIPLGLANQTDLSLELTIPAKGWKSFTFRLKSLDGISSMNDPVYRVELLVDQPPMVSLVQPKKDRLALLSRDQLSLNFRASDDFGLKQVALHYRVFRPGLSELTEASESGQIPVKVPTGEKSLVQTLEWDLGRLVPPLTPACRLSCWIEAEDNNTATGPSIAKSIEKSITIVSEEQKRLELLELVGERAKAIEKLYDMQRTANEKTDQSIK